MVMMRRRRGTAAVLQMNEDKERELQLWPLHFDCLYRTASLGSFTLHACTPHPTTLVLGRPRPRMRRPPLIAQDGVLPVAAATTIDHGFTGIMDAEVAGCERTVRLGRDSHT